MGALLDKLLRIIGFEDETIKEEVKLEMEPVVESLHKSKGRKVISLPNSGRMRVVVVEPTCFEDAKRVVDHLTGRRPIIINLESTGEELAQRIIDFVSGATFATDGAVQKVGQGIFLFTPNNIEITAEEQKAEIEMGEPGFPLG